MIQKRGGREGQRDYFKGKKREQRQHRPKSKKQLCYPLAHRTKLRRKEGGFGKISKKRREEWGIEKKLFRR